MMKKTMIARITITSLEVRMIRCSPLDCGNLKFVDIDVVAPCRVRIIGIFIEPIRQVFNQAPMIDRRDKASVWTVVVFLGSHAEDGCLEEILSYLIP